jgi:hypothetical protein
MQQFANTHSMRNEILSQMAQNGLEDDCYVEMLDYTIDLFESQGLGTEYYGYHNICITFSHKSRKNSTN